MNSLPEARRQQLQRVQWYSLGVGVVVLAGCGVGALFLPQPFARAYLAAYLFFLGIGLGCFALLMVYFLTGGAWGFLIRRILEAGMRTLPLLAILFVPVACGVYYLYPWTDPELVRVSHTLQHREIYLNVPFFCVRAALFFGVWTGFAVVLDFWSRRQDRTGEPRLGLSLTRLSGPGLVVYGITIMFASIDWVMSLQPAFRSTIFGPLVASGQVLSGLAWALLVLAWVLAAAPPEAKVVSLEALNDLGNLLFTFVIIWAYLAFFQFMLIWIADLRYDILWLLPRGRDGWQYVAWALCIFHFVVPFFLLLLRDVKQNPRLLAGVAALLLVMQLVYSYFQVMPAFPDTGLAEHWIDFLTPLGLGGIWLAFFLWNLQRYPLLPLHDANEKAALHYRELDREEAAREEVVHHE